MYCLRCGAKTQEERSFCDGCTERVGKPLENSPYLPIKYTLPNRRTNPVPKRPEAKKERKKRPWRWILSTVLLILLSAALLLQGGWFFTNWLNNEAELGRINLQNERLQDEIAMLRDSLTQAEQDTAQLQELLEGLETELTDTQKELAHLQQKIEVSSELVVFVNQEEDGLFHRLDCKNFAAHEFSAYLREYALQQGFAPCKLCQP